MKIDSSELKNIKLFHAIKEESLTPMLSCIGGNLRSYPKNSFIFYEQEDIRNIGIVLSGSVQMIKEDIWGNKTIFALIKKGDLFGETFACSSGNTSLVTFVAAEDARILILPFNRTMHVCTTTCKFHHRLIENMVLLIAEKNKILMEKLSIISKKTLREKILAYLFTQAQRSNSKTFQISLGRIALADYLCTDRSALTRELANMKMEGLIDFSKNDFTLLTGIKT